jgi:hypothetical protein
MEEAQPRPGEKVLTVVFSLLFLMLLVGAILLARRNLRLGRGDRRGAFKVALFLWLLFSVDWILSTSHVPSLNDELNLLLKDLPIILFLAALAWLIYLALEPFLRRRWPDAMVSWSRLLAGRLRDPLVGRDLLVGAVAFAGLSLLDLVEPVVARAMGVPPPNPGGINSAVLLGGRRLVAQLVGGLFGPIMVTMFILFVLLLLRVILRKHWLAMAGLAVIFSLPAFATVDPRLLPLHLVLQALGWVVIFLMLSRFGLLSVCALFFFLQIFSTVPTADFSAWYGSNTVVLLLAMAVVAGFGFYTSLAGRPILAESMVPQE